jgi:hypothetical protein
MVVVGLPYLLPEDMAEPLDFVISHRMRNLEELVARIQDGQKVSPTKMEAMFLPYMADFTRIANRLGSQGPPFFSVMELFRGNRLCFVGKFRN